MAIGFATVGVLAHQGGWDEILLVLTPVVLFAALLWLANTRATRIQDERTAPRGATPDDQATVDDATGDEATDADPGTDPGS